MPPRPPNLARQLSRSSSPYCDPVTRIPWESLDLDQYWLPPDALSLYGLPAFDNLPEPARKRVSQLELLNFVASGLWLEAIFMARIAASLSVTNADRDATMYRLHELREEAGHSLMFLELMNRAPLEAPAPQRTIMRLADLSGRYAPINSLIFSIATVLGEEIPDQLNRHVRSQSGAICPTIAAICVTHMIDEARHIAYARAHLEAVLGRVHAWHRAAIAPVVRRLLREFVTAFFYPSSELYEQAGLYPGNKWAKIARQNPHRVEFVAHCLSPPLHVLRAHGLSLSWGKKNST